jgi:hypothetical protein
MLGAFRETIAFYGLCAKWAATGTLERANAWFWLIGIPGIAFVRYLRGEIDPMTIPDHIPAFLGFMAATVAISWVVFFVIRFLRAPAHFYTSAQNEIGRYTTAIASFNERLKPKINLSLDERTRGVAFAPTEFMGSPPRSGPPSKWVQFCVSCATDTSLIDCEAFLTSGYKLDDTDQPTGEQLIEEDINCAWSQLGETKVTIHPLRVLRANIFSIYESLDRIVVKPETVPMKIRLRNAIQTPGRYRLQTLVTARDAPSKTESFIFEWRDFNNVTLTPH